MENIYTMDWHIHTLASYDATMSYKELIKSTKEGGIVEFGITEHADHIFDLAVLEFSRKMFETIRWQHRDEELNMHFGVELSPMCDFMYRYEREQKWSNVYPGQLAGLLPEFVEGFGTHDPELVRRSRQEIKPYMLSLTEEQIRKLGIEYVIGAAHNVYDGSTEREGLINHFHEQMMFCATDERVDIVGHPWWGLWTTEIHFETIETGEPTKRAWYQDFKVIPQAMHDEFAAAVLENGKCVEMNMSSLRSGPYSDKFRHQYVEYMRDLFEKGVPITTGTDSHDVYENHQELYAKFLKPAGFKAEDFSKPKFRTYEK